VLTGPASQKDVKSLWNFGNIETSYARLELHAHITLRLSGTEKVFPRQLCLANYKLEKHYLH